MIYARFTQQFHCLAYSDTVKIAVLYSFFLLLSLGVGTTYAADLRVLNVGLGSTSGTVSSDIAGISCGADCSENYPDVTTVTLTANTTAGTVFSGWEGDCSGSSLSCVVTTNAARSVRLNSI